MRNTRKQLDPADLSTDHQTPQERFQHMMGKEGVLPDLSLGMKGKVSVCQKCTCFLNSPLGGNRRLQYYVSVLDTRMWWHTPDIPVFGSHGIHDKFEASWSYIVGLRL